MNIPLVFLVSSPLISFALPEFLKENICSPKALTQLFKKELFLPWCSALNNAIHIQEQLAADKLIPHASPVLNCSSSSLSPPSFKKSISVWKEKETKGRKDRCGNDTKFKFV